MRIGYMPSPGIRAAQVLDAKQSVRAATTANIVLSGLQTIDDVALVAGGRALAKDQTAGAENGIYIVNSGAWARASDADTSEKLTSGLQVLVEGGTRFARISFVLTTPAPITLGVTALTFAAAGGGALADLTTVDLFTPTDGQTAFVLSKIPKVAASIEFKLNGINYYTPASWTLTGQTITWLGAEFSTQTTDRVEIRYT